MACEPSQESARTAKLRKTSAAVRVRAGCIWGARETRSCFSVTYIRYSAQKQGLETEHPRFKQLSKSKGFRVA